ncbi:hypothetical protein JCM11251_005812 [Rhodosporidiobolus azoricus]
MHLPTLLLPLLVSFSSSLLSSSSSSLGIVLASPSPDTDSSIFTGADLEKRNPEPGKVDHHDQDKNGWSRKKGWRQWGHHDDHDGDDDGDWKKDVCPRRFHRNRHGKCVRNHGYGGCHYGYRRNRYGFCIRDHRDYDGDNDYDRAWRHKSWTPRKGWCPRDYKPSGSGHDGYPFDYHGNGPPSWVPDGWAYFGSQIGWAPYKGWAPSRSWKPPVIFLKIVIKVVWWSPSREWCDYYSNRWHKQYSSYQIPSHWHWKPNRRHKERSLNHGDDAGAGTA